MKQFRILAGFIFFPVILLNSCNNAEDVVQNEEQIRDEIIVDEVFDEVSINNQVWMKENLNVERFSNGDVIKNAKTVEEWRTANENKEPAWCYYDNKFDDTQNLGKLYNWYAVNDTRGLAPKGWLVASSGDWDKLIKFLGGDDNAGGKLKSASNWSDNGNGSNESELNIYPTGSRDENGVFDGYGEGAGFWTSSESDNLNSRCVLLMYLNNTVYNLRGPKNQGLSVRCVKE